MSINIKEEFCQFEMDMINIAQQELRKESVKTNPALKKHYQETIRIAKERILQIPTWTNAECKAQFDGITSWYNKYLETQQTTIEKNPQLESHLEADPKVIENKMQELILDKITKLGSPKQVRLVSVNCNHR